MTVQPSVSGLLDRVRVGDREAAALLLTRYSPLIRQRCRLRMRQALRAVTDSEDVWSTVARRFDAMLAQGGVVIESERAFWVLVGKLVEHAIVDRNRVLKRLERATDDDEPFAATLRARLVAVKPAESEGSLIRLVDSLPDPVDRDVVRLWLAERSHAAIGASLGLSEGAVRARWHSIRHELREVLENVACLKN